MIRRTSRAVISRLLTGPVLPSLAAMLAGASPLAANNAMAQERLFTGRVDVTGLPATVTAVVVKCSLKQLVRTLSEAETTIPTALDEAGARRAAASFTVSVRANPAARTYECQLGFRSGTETRWAGIQGIGCGEWRCGAAGSVIRKTGPLP